MSNAEFNTREVFDEDYLYFYDTFITDEQSDADVEVIWKLLGLQPGKRVLDMACGTGRIANRLAGLGCDVVGLDESELFLELARSLAPTNGGEITFVRNDMRRLQWEGEFDAVINWFTSFGYFSREDNFKCLSETYKALKTNGQVLIDHINRDRLIRNLSRPLDMVIEHPHDDGNFLIDRVAYDVATGRTETDRTIVRDGATRKTHFSVRLFTYAEIHDWIIRAGFRDCSGFGSQGDELSLDSGRMIVVARK